MAQHRNVLPSIVIALMLIATGLLLHQQGRLWICQCGTVKLWVGNIWSADNSQHLFDPYTFTHVLHGFIFCGVLALAVPRLSFAWRLSLATVIEAAWEVFENSAFIIDRYRTVTLALGYTGDTVVNSLTDILACIIGALLARRLGVWKSAALFIATELALALWIRDGLLLNLLMLVYPIPSIRTWQMGA